MIAILFILALALRIIAVITPAIWYDEAFTLHVAALPIAQIFTIHDFTLPVWELLLHPFVTLFPSVITIRIAALVLSMLTLYIAYRITLELSFTREQTLLTLFLVATLPGLIWTGSDGRVYALLGCMYLLGIYAVLIDRRTLLFVVSVCLLYIHATGFFFVFTLYYYWLVEGERDLSYLIPDCAALAALGLLAYLPLLHRTADGLFVPMTITYFISQWTMAFFIGTSQTIWLIGFFIFGLTILVLHYFDNADVTFVLLPLTLLLLASFSTVNLVTYRTLSPTLIPFAMLVAKSYKGQAYEYQGLTALVWITLLTFSAGTYNFAAKGSQQAQAAQRINTGERIVYATLTVALPFDYYLPNSESCILKTSPDGALIGGYDFGFDRCTADELHASYWLVIPTDPSITAAALAQMNILTKHGQIITELTYPQISPVNVWRIER